MASQRRREPAPGQGRFHKTFAPSPHLCGHACSAHGHPPPPAKPPSSCKASTVAPLACRIRRWRKAAGSSAGAQPAVMPPKSNAPAQRRRRTSPDGRRTTLDTGRTHPSARVRRTTSAGKPDRMTPDTTPRTLPLLVNMPPQDRRSSDPASAEPCVDDKRALSEISFGRFNEWRRVASPQARCPRSDLSAVAPATVVVWANASLGGLSPQSKCSGMLYHRPGVRALPHPRPEASATSSSGSQTRKRAFCTSSAFVLAGATSVVPAASMRECTR